MIRSVNISFDGMTITGTVESPDSRPARYFRRSAERVTALALLTTDPIPRVFGNWGWTEFAPVERELIDESGLLG